MVCPGVHSEDLKAHWFRCVLGNRFRSADLLWRFSELAKRVMGEVLFWVGTGAEESAYSQI